MKRVKIFDEPHEKDLEDDINEFINTVDEIYDIQFRTAVSIFSINEFINTVDEIYDIQFRTAVSIFSEDQIYCFSAMIVYEA